VQGSTIIGVILSLVISLTISLVIFGSVSVSLRMVSCGLSGVQLCVRGCERVQWGPIGHSGAVGGQGSATMGVILYLVISLQISLARVREGESE
jgi:hypothetical protein